MTKLVTGMVPVITDLITAGGIDFAYITKIPGHGNTLGKPKTIRLDTAESEPVLKTAEQLNCMEGTTDSRRASFRKTAKGSVSNMWNIRISNATPICADTQLGIVYCKECWDMIYDPTLDNIYQQVILTIEEQETKLLGPDEKRPREPYQSWKPGEKDLAALVLTTAFPAAAGAVVQNKEDCACRELGGLFAATHTLPVPALGPTALLATTWRATGSLAGYAQKDADECLIALLNAAHHVWRATSKRHALPALELLELVVSEVWQGLTRGEQMVNRLPLCPASSLRSVVHRPHEDGSSTNVPFATAPDTGGSSLEVLGTIDNGHYTGSAHFHDTWCRFDADEVIFATPAEVLGTTVPIYTLYVKWRLDYKPHSTPSYILTREGEGERREALAAMARAEQEQALER
ncbi:hypothetical protein BJY52DRAFT_1421707 [Lactarius psammicola]|nr:hypothetical protein BJY52DRAFT_1421707 [Lactarius psammicola]